VKLGKEVTLPQPDLVNLYGCEIGDECLIGPFVEIQSGVKVGKGSRVQSHTFICSKVTIGENVFVGHGVMFINDRYPVRRDPEDWEETVVEDGVAIGSNATILPCQIGKGAMVAAGAVVTKDVPPGKTVAGNPAKIIGERKKANEKN
jgi:acetyltransferase-like isoleucine patch superfamily enzyme